MSNIFHLGGTPPTTLATPEESTPVNEELVGMLEVLLDKAKSAELQSLFVAGYRFASPKHKPAFIMEIALGTANPHLLLGCIEHGKQLFIDHLPTLL